MKFKDFFTIVIVIILTIIGGAIAYKYYIADIAADPAPQFGTVLEAPVADQIYTNNLIGFGFRYPSRYEIVNESVLDLSGERERRVSVLNMTLEAKDIEGKPRLNFYVNYEVPITRSSRTLTLLQDDIGLYLAEIAEDESFESHEVRTFGSIVMDDDNVYAWEFIFEMGQYDYIKDLELMLSTFGIYRTTEPIDEEADSLDKTE